MPQRPPHGGALWLLAACEKASGGRDKDSGDAELDRHVGNAVARETGRGWRVDKASRSAQVDAVVALAMALERAEAKPELVQLLGWL